MTIIKKLISLIAFNNKKIETLRKELSSIQLELKFEGDKDILKRLMKNYFTKQGGEQLKRLMNLIRNRCS